MTQLVTDVKARAKRLRDHLSTYGKDITHSQSLETIAATAGYRDWNTYVASLKKPSPRPAHAFPLDVGSRISGLYRETPFEGVLLGLEQTINTGIWRIKVHFDEPVKPPQMARIGLARQRVNCTVNADGISVNLLGKKDSELKLHIKKS